MKKLLLILVVISFVSCQDGDIKSLDSYETAMNANKFEFEGNHYIQFKMTNIHGGGVTLDPDYMFKGDTIVYGGNKYIKLNQ